MKVSFLVSTYNAAVYLDRCIRDLFNQTVQDSEIVIVNPNSPDKDGEIAKKWQKKYPERIQYIYCPEREPYGQSWLRAWKASRSEYVINTNTDDLRDPNMASLLLQTMEKDNDIGFAYPANMLVINEQGEITGGGTKPQFNVERFQRQCEAGPCVMWRRDLIDKIDFDKAWKRAGIYWTAFDYYLWLAILKLGYKGCCVPQATIYYTQRKESIENSSGHMSTYQSLCIIAEHFPKALENIAQRENNEVARWFKNFPYVPDPVYFGEVMRSSGGMHGDWSCGTINILEEIESDGESPI